MREWCLGMREWCLGMREWCLGKREWCLGMREWCLGKIQPPLKFLSDDLFPTPHKSALRESFLQPKFASDGFHPTPRQIEMQPVKLLSSPLQICVRRLEIRRPSKAPARQICDILEKDRLEGVSTRRSCTYPASHVLTPAAIELPVADAPTPNLPCASRFSNPPSNFCQTVFAQPQIVPNPPPYLVRPRVASYVLSLARRCGGRLRLF